METTKWIVTWENFAAQDGWPFHEQEWFSDETKARAFITTNQNDYPTEEYKLARVVEIFPAKKKRNETQR